MKQPVKSSIMATLCAMILFTVSGAAFAAPFKSASLGGTTGLVSTPTAKTGWEDAHMGLDAGYHYVSDDNGDTSNIIGATFNFLGKAEVGLTVDLQDRDADDEDDYIIHGKFNFYNSGSSALAIGGNYQKIDDGNDATEGKAYQFYFAVTYAGTFLGMPAESTIVVGKTMGDDDKYYQADDKNIDFSMGFDLDFLPQFLKGYVHWISDFSNYSYSVDPMGANAMARGCFNTGFRIAPLRDSRYKLNIDVLMTDALDENRSWTVGVAGGLSF
jgi:hypothetical protein